MNYNYILKKNSKESSIIYISANLLISDLTEDIPMSASASHLLWYST